MNTSQVDIHFDGDTRTYRPGDTLSGEYRLPLLSPGEIKAVEVSVLWYTEGKGDEDLAMHDFRRVSPEEGDRIDPHRPIPFSSTLPNSPASYDGLIVKIRWCVRVLVFLRGGKEVVGEAPFVLGSVPPAKAVLS